MIEFEDRLYDPQALIEKLSSQVTEERLQRIHKTVGQRSQNLVTVLENIYDRGNSSAVMRSAEAFGFHNIHHIVEIDEFKESKRVTQGAEKWLLQNQWPQTEECIHHLKKKGYRILVTHLEDAQPLHEVDFSTPTALCFGSEKDGASETLSQLADARVCIPMHGFVQSFNISVAAALCYQSIRRDLGSDYLLSDEERQWLTALYLVRSCRNPMLPPPIAP